MIDVGNAAPVGVFLALDGNTRKISDYRGKALVLYFYPKDDTSGCTNEAQAFSEREHEFARAGAVVVGVSKDSVKSHNKFIHKYDLTVALGSDESGALCEAFGVWVEKSMYGRQYMGIERATFLIGADGRIVEVWRKVRVAGHAAAVLTAAQAIA